MRKYNLLKEIPGTATLGGILGIAGLIIWSGIQGLQNDKKWRDELHRANMGSIVESVKVFGGTNGIIPFPAAQEFLKDMGFKYDIRKNDAGVALRTYLHNRLIDVNVVRTNSFSNRTEYVESTLGQVNNATLGFNSIRKQIK